MATQEKIKQVVGFEIEVYGKTCTHIRSITGTGYKVPSVDATSSGSSQQTSTVGRASFEPLVIRFALAPSNKFMLQSFTTYLNNSQDEKRTPITIKEITHDGSKGQTWNLFDCFGNRMVLPEGNSGSGQVEVEMEFSFNRKEEVTGGQNT